MEEEGGGGGVEVMAILEKWILANKAKWPHGASIVFASQRERT